MVEYRRSKSAYSSFRSHSSTLNSSRYILCGNSERELHNHSHTQNGGFGGNELHLSCVACKQLNRLAKMNIQLFGFDDQLSIFNSSSLSFRQKGR